MPNSCKKIKHKIVVSVSKLCTQINCNLSQTHAKCIVIHTQCNCNKTICDKINCIVISTT